LSIAPRARGLCANRIASQRLIGSFFHPFILLTFNLCPLSLSLLSGVRDIALVSDVFEGIRIKDRSKIRKITLDISSDLSPIPFRPEEFTLEDPFVREIIEHGIIIKEA